ncbi:MAG TPA: hypothetical protein VEB66_06585 [Opitutaceae bacterium]|nr:hypothetical protein [Opitutaceae bacterium]
MPRITYVVRASFPSLQVRGRYLSWLAPDHVEAVRRGGADSVRITLYDPASPEGRPALETEYTFPSRKAFDAYVRDHAPALRADGLKHFPPESGVTFERRVGELCYES